MAGKARGVQRLIPWKSLSFVSQKLVQLEVACRSTNMSKPDENIRRQVVGLAWPTNFSAKPFDWVDVQVR